MSRPHGITEKKKLFVSRYGPVYDSTDICSAWRRHHSNCVGCKHKEQCNKYIDWLVATAMGRDPNTFLDDLDNPEGFTEE